MTLPARPALLAAALLSLAGVTAAQLPIGPPTEDPPAKPLTVTAPPKKADTPAPKPKDVPPPTAAAVDAVLAKFKAERAAALGAKFPAADLARADESAKRADEALKGDNTRAALRHARDARWQVPYLPPGLPEHVVRVLGESRLRHADRVNALAYSPDGTRLATASRDGTVKVWDLGNGRELVGYRKHRDTPVDSKVQGNVLKVADVAWSPNGQLVASVGENELHLWDPADGSTVKVITRKENAEKPFKSVAFRPDGKAVAAGGEDQVLHVYDIATGKASYTSPPQAGRIEGVAFSPNGKLVAAVNNSGQLTVYAPGTPNEIALGLPVAGSEAYDVAFTADGSGLLTAGRDGRVKLTVGPNPDGGNAPTTANTLREYVGHTEAVRSLGVSGDGTVLVTGSLDKSVRVWDVASGRQLRAFQGHLTEVVAVAVRADGRQVASAGEDGTLRLWDLSPTDDHRAVSEAGDSLWTIAFAPDGKRFAAAGADRVVRVYDTATGKLEAALPPRAGAVTAVAFLDNNRLASVGGDKVVAVWDASAGKLLKELPGHESAVLALAAAPGGKLLVSGAADRTVRGWDADSGKLLWTWAGRSAVCAVAVRKDGKLVAVGCADGAVVTLDVSGETPKEVATQTAHLAGVAGLAFDADGTRLATAGGDGNVKVWTAADAGGLAPLGEFKGQTRTGAGFSPVSAVAFSPDGRFVASCGSDQAVRVWDLQTKGEVRGLRGHTDWVTSVAFSPDGRYLLSAGVDRAARLWELTHQDTAPPPGHAQTVRAVAVSPDGRLAATASTDRTIKLWDLADGREAGTLLGAVEKMYSVGFVGPDKLVSGGELNTGDAGRVQFWSVRPPKAEKGTPTGRVFNVVGAADGSKAAAWSVRPAVGDEGNHTFELFDGDGKPTGSLADRGRKVQAVGFSPDLQWAASGDAQGAVRIWNLAKRETVGGDFTLFDKNPVADLAISPDKTRLVAVDTAGQVKVGDLTNPRAWNVLGRAEAHPAGINGILISPKGDTFVTLGTDGEVKAWDLKGVKELRTWKCPVTVWGAAYTPDGKRLLTANGDGTAYVLAMP